MAAFDEVITRQRVDDLRKLTELPGNSPEFRETVEALVSFYMKYRHLEQQDPHELEYARSGLSCCVTDDTVRAIEDLVQAKINAVLREKLG